MNHRMRVISYGLATLALVLGCGKPPPSLTGEELAEKYPDKKYVQIDGVSLRYEQTGLGRPLIFLHGFPMYSFVWRHIRPALTYGSTVYELDLMGFGYSEKPQNVPYSLDTYITQLSRFINDFHLENPILAGHDVGAVIATLYTLRNPGKVYKLIIMSGPLYSAAPPIDIRLLRTRLIGNLFTGDWFLKRIFRGGVANPDIMTERLLKEYLEPYRDDPGARPALLKFLREFDLRPTLENEIDPNLGKLDLPTLIVWGSQDAYTPLDFGRRLEQDIPNAEFKVVLRTGHYFQEERPEELRALIKEFIQQRP